MLRSMVSHFKLVIKHMDSPTIAGVAEINWMCHVTQPIIAIICLRVGSYSDLGR